MKLDSLLSSTITSLLVFAILALAISFPYHQVVLDWDEGLFLLISQGILDGKTPYKDLADNKGPIFYLLLTIPILLFGKWEFGYRILGLLLAGVNAWLLFQLAKRWFSTNHAALAGLLLLIYSLHPFYLGYLLIAEPFINLFSLLALLAAPSESSLAPYAAGLLAGAVPLMRLNAIYIPLIVAANFFASSKRKVPFLISLIIPALASFLWLASSGALPAFIYYTIQVPLDARGIFSDIPPISDGGLAVRIQSFSSNLVLLLPLVAFAAWGAYRKWGPQTMMLCIWALLSLLAPLFGPTQFAHHYLLALPPLVLLSIHGINELVQQEQPSKYFPHIRGALFFFLLVGAVIFTVTFIAGAFLSLQTHSAHSSTMTGEEHYALLEFMRSNPGPTFLFPAMPEAYFLTHTYPPSQIPGFYHIPWFSHASDEEFDKYFAGPLAKSDYAVTLDNFYYDKMADSQAGQRFLSLLNEKFEPIKQQGRLIFYRRIH